MTAGLRFREGGCAHGAVSSSSIVAIRTPTTVPRFVASPAISSTVDASIRGSEAR